MNITIPDPDDPSGQPLYDGSLAEVSQWLVPGEYHAWMDQDEAIPGRVFIPEEGQPRFAVDRQE